MKCSWKKDDPGKCSPSDKCYHEETTWGFYFEGKNYKFKTRKEAEEFLINKGGIIARDWEYYVEKIIEDEYTGGKIIEISDDKKSVYVEYTYDTGANYILPNLSDPLGDGKEVNLMKYYVHLPFEKYSV